MKFSKKTWMILLAFLAVLVFLLLSVNVYEEGFTETTSVSLTTSKWPVTTSKRPDVVISDLVIWLDAQDITPGKNIYDNNNNIVWPDKSGNKNDFIFYNNDGTPLTKSIKVTKQTNNRIADLPGGG